MQLLSGNPNQKSAKSALLSKQVTRGVSRDTTTTTATATATGSRIRTIRNSSASRRRAKEEKKSSATPWPVEAVSEKCCPRQLSRIVSRGDCDWIKHQGNNEQQPAAGRNEWRQLPSNGLRKKCRFEVVGILGRREYIARSQCTQSTYHSGFLNLRFQKFWIL